MLFYLIPTQWKIANDEVEVSYDLGIQEKWLFTFGDGVELDLELVPDDL
jgi:hypothetical protein